MTRQHRLLKLSALLNSAALLVYAFQSLLPVLLDWATSPPGMHRDYIFAISGPVAYGFPLVRALPLLLLAVGVSIQVYLLTVRIHETIAGQRPPSSNVGSPTNRRAPSPRSPAPSLSRCR